MTLNQQTIAVFVSVLLVFSLLGCVAITPNPGEEFLQLYVLGENGMIEDYYPNGNTTVPLNTQVKWFLGVANSMKSAQYVTVKVKLGNSTLTPPNETQAEPAPLPSLVEYRRMLSSNETWAFSFNWVIEDVQVVGDMVYVRNMTFNGNPITVPDVGAQQGRNLRLIFELWSFNKEAGDFIFGWYEGQERRCAWLQMWFNVTSPA